MVMTVAGCAEDVVERLVTAAMALTAAALSND
jgi:hypothetical protein